MQPVSAHRIGRLTWRVQAASSSAALSQRRMLCNDWESILLPTLERVFDRFAAHGQVLRIPKLTLQIATDNHTMADLADCVEKQLSSVLADICQGANSRQAPEASTSQADQPTASLTTTAVYRRELLMGYLRGGRLDWSISFPADTNDCQWLRTEAGEFAAEPTALQRLCTGSLQTQSEVCFRLLQLLDPADRERLLYELAKPLVKLVNWIFAAEVGDFWRLRWAAMLLVLCRDERCGPIVQSISKQLAVQPNPAVVQGLPPTIAEALEKYRTEVADGWPALLTALIGIAASPTANTTATTAAPGPVLGDVNRRASDAAGTGSVPVTSASDQTLSPAAPSPAAALSPLPSDDIQRASDRLNRHPDLDETIASTMVQGVMAAVPAAVATQRGLLAHDAGLILLHPFLGRLFAEVGIRSPGEPRLLQAELPRAAALLHWLASGREAVFEFEPTLGKVLLGLASDDPLPVGEGLLSSADYEEGRAVLAAVVDHWSVLGQTSIDGLRTSFLQRRGILRHDANGWRLRMETESFDLLLGQLPWGISVVKLPWMPHALFTEWPPPA